MSVTVRMKTGIAGPGVEGSKGDVIEIHDTMAGDGKTKISAEDQARRLIRLGAAEEVDPKNPQVKAGTKEQEALARQTLVETEEVYQDRAGMELTTRYGPRVRKDFRRPPPVTVVSDRSQIEV